MGRSNQPRRLSWLERLGIRNGLGGGRLTCGCAYGRYVTYGDQVLTVIDDAEACREGHAAGAIVDEAALGVVGSVVHATVSDPPERPPRP